MWNEWKVYESLFVLLYLDLVPQRRWSRIDQIGRGRGGVGLWAKSHQLHTVTNQVQLQVRCCKVITLTINCDVSLIPASEWWSRPMKYSYEFCVCITWQLYHIPCDFYYFPLLSWVLLRPNSSNLPCLYSTFHLEYPLVLSRFCISRPSVLFGAINVIVTSWFCPRYARRKR